MTGSTAIVVENISFSEALKAAWSRPWGTSWCITRAKDGVALQWGKDRRYSRRYPSGRLKHSTLAPDVPSYWLQGDDWTLYVD